MLCTQMMIPIEKKKKKLLANGWRGVSVLVMPVAAKYPQETCPKGGNNV